MFGVSSAMEVFFVREVRRLGVLGFLGVRVLGFRILWAGVFG